VATHAPSAPSGHVPHDGKNKDTTLCSDGGSKGPNHVFTSSFRVPYVKTKDLSVIFVSLNEMLGWLRYFLF
jgi:hypothetical protein